MSKINCLNPIAAVGMDLLTDAYQKVDAFADADAVLVRSASVHDLELHDGLLAIARAGAGVNNIPLDKCADNGIVVFNTPGANANGVKELVIAGMFLAARDIVGGIEWVQTVKDNADVAKLVEKEKSKFGGTEIKGKKLGVIGLGAIGIKVANAAVSLGMEVYGYDPFISVENAWHLSRAVKHAGTTEDIYKDCDYISVHVPLLDDTKEMINKTSIETMKDGVVVLNFSRDLLVNDTDMAEALASGKVKKYVTDFPNAKSAGMDGCIAVPHLGASTEESEDNCAVMAVQQIMDYIENGNIKNSVNYPDCDMGICTRVARVAILHKNVPNMISQFAAAFAAENINISDMLNKSRKEYSYILIDVDSPIPNTLLEKINSIEGVIRSRVIKA